MPLISGHSHHDAWVPFSLNSVCSRFRMALPLVALLSFHPLHASASDKAEDYVFAGKVKEDLSSQTSSVLRVAGVTKTEIAGFVEVDDSAMVENEGAGWKVVETVKTASGFDVKISFPTERNYVEEGRSCYFTTWEYLEVRLVTANPEPDWRAVLELYQAVEGKEKLAGIVAKRLNVALDNASEVSPEDAKDWLGIVKTLGAPDGAIVREQPFQNHLGNLKRVLDAAIEQRQVERSKIRDDYLAVFGEEPFNPEPPAVLLVANVGEVDLLLMILGGREVKAAGQTLFEISPQPSPQRESWRFEPIGPVADKYRGGTFARPVDLQPGCTSRVEIAAAPKGPPRLASVNRMNVPVTVSVNGLAPFRLGASSASTNDLSSVGGMAEGAAAAADHPEDYEPFAFKTNALQDEIATVEIVLKAKAAPVVMLSNRGDVNLSVVVGGRSVGLKSGQTEQVPLDPRKAATVEASVDAEHPEDYEIGITGAAEKSASGSYSIRAMLPGQDAGEVEVTARLRPAPKLVLDNGGNAVEVRYTIRDTAGKEVTKGSVRATGRGEVEVPVRTELGLAYEAEAEGYHVPQPLKVAGLARGATSTVSLPLAQKDPVLPLKNEGLVPLEVTIEGVPPFRLDPGAAVEHELKPRTQPVLRVRVAAEHPEDYSVLLQKGPRAKWEPVEADVPLPALEPGTQGSEWRFKAEQRSAPKLVLDNSGNAVEVRYTISKAAGGEVTKGSLRATGRGEVEVPVRSELIVAYEAEAEGYRVPEPLKVAGLSRGAESPLALTLKPKSKPKLNLVNETAVDARVEVVGIASVVVEVPKGGKMVVEVPANREIKLVCSAADPNETYVKEVSKPQSFDWEQEVDFKFKLNPDQTKRVAAILKKGEDSSFRPFENTENPNTETPKPIQEEEVCLFWAMCYYQSIINKDYLDRLKADNQKPAKHKHALRIEDTRDHLDMTVKFGLADRRRENRKDDLKYVNFDNEAGNSGLAGFRSWVEDDPVGNLKTQLDELEKLGRQ